MPKHRMTLLSELTEQELRGFADYLQETQDYIVFIRKNAPPEADNYEAIGFSFQAATPADARRTLRDYDVAKDDLECFLRLYKADWRIYRSAIQQPPEMSPFLLILRTKAQMDKSP